MFTSPPSDTDFGTIHLLPVRKNEGFGGHGMVIMRGFEGFPNGKREYMTASVDVIIIGQFSFRFTDKAILQTGNTVAG